MDGTSLNITEDLVNQLKAIVPQAFSEDKIDIQKLQTLLGEAVVTDSERYQLSWAGKSEAYKILQTPTTATLIPQPEESINWDEAKNVFIEGENLEALKVLQKSYYGKVKMIYIDPPYNTGSDSFIYPDKFSESKEEYLKRIGEKDEEGFMMKEGLFRKNSKENGQFHSNWLNMMLPRLFLARNLLKDDGVIFVSIDDNEQANLKLLMDEVFGEENFIDCIIWKKRYGGGAKEKYLVTLHEYILFYAKDINKIDPIYIPTSEESINRYYVLKDENFAERGGYRTHPLEATKSMGDRPNLIFPILAPDGSEVYPKRQWLWGKERVADAVKKGEIAFLKDKKGDYSVHTKQYLKDENGETRQSKAFSIIEDVFTQHGTNEIIELFGNAQVFSFPKPISFLKKLISVGTKPDTNDIVFDFFSGSGSLAHAVIACNEEDNGDRNFICVQLPELTEEGSEAQKAGFETISSISEARIKKVIKGLEENRKGKLELQISDLLGLRKYSLSVSNFKIWRGDIVENEEELKAQMELFITPQRANVRTENILWELLIKNGVQLTEKIVKVELTEGASIYHTADNRFAFVLDKYSIEVQAKVLELKPRTFICLDSLFQNEDSVKTNALLKFEDNGITFKTI